MTLTEIQEKHLHNQGHDIYISLGYTSMRKYNQSMTRMFPDRPPRMSWTEWVMRFELGIKGSFVLAKPAVIDIAWDEDFEIVTVDLEEVLACI